MIKQFKKSHITLSIAVMISMTGCARFDTRMQANGPFNYQESTLNTKYITTGYTQDESRDLFVIPKLSQYQKDNGLRADAVDIRPPTQLIKIMDGIIEDKDHSQGTRIWFNDFQSQQELTSKVSTLLNDFLISKNATYTLAKNNGDTIEPVEIKEEISFGNFFK